MKQILGTIFAKLITIALVVSSIMLPNQVAAATDPTGDPPPAAPEFSSSLIIRAVNPGYTINGRSNVGELIVLRNVSDVSLSLAGFSLRYTNGAGNSHTILTFVDGTLIAGKDLLIRYYKSPEHDSAHVVYSGSLAMKAGPLQLVHDGEVVDEVCWTGKGDCLPDFKKATPTTIVRDLENGEYRHLLNEEVDFRYEPDAFITAPDSSDDTDPDNPEDLPPQCQGLEFSELLTYYTQDKSEQFVELYNSTSSNIVLDGCTLVYKNKVYPLSGSISGDSYYAYPIASQIALTKNPKNPLTLTLVDINGSPVDEIAYPNGQKKSTSYARIIDSTGAESWQITYAPTPGSENIYQQYQACAAGKVVNEATGNCVKVTSLSLNSSSTLAECPAGKYRNPLTGRCKNIESASSTLKPCAEGYERNPETNRCRKVTSNAQNDGADYALVPTTHSDQTVFIGAGIVTLIVALGVVYIILQFRHEIARATRKVSQRFNRARQNFLTRLVSLHRHKKP